MLTMERSFQAVKSTTPILSGVLILPVACTAAITGIAVGVFIHRTGRYVECIYLGTALMTLANGLFILFDATTSLGTVIGFQIIQGIGAGLLFEPPLIAIQSMVSQDDTATATSTFSFVRSLGTCMSVVIGGVVFQNSMELRRSFLRTAGLSEDLVQKFSGKDAAANVMLIRTIANPAHQFAVKEAFAWSMRNMWILYMSVGLLGFAASFFITKQHLKQEHTETITGLKKEKEESGMEMR
jgi:MFS family permease